MRYLQIIAVSVVLTCLSSTTAQTITTQVAAPSTTGPVQMETPAPSSTTESHGLDTNFLHANIASVMNKAIAEGSLPGGVVLVLRADHTVFLEAYGTRAIEPDVEPATTDTIYDMASLTKPVATATSIMQLVEKGQIRLTDPVSRYIPGWKNTAEEESNKALLKKLEKAIEQNKLVSQLPWTGIDDETVSLLKAAGAIATSSRKSSDYFDLRPRDRESITIRHLLVHMSGLPPFLRYYEKYPEGSAREKIVSDIAQTELRGPAGGQFIYSDLGFIVLGDIVERITGMRLDEYSQKNIFEPLGMKDTMFTPPPETHSRIAPTEWTTSDTSGSVEFTRTMIRGRVHDGNAFVQDGVSGHAGMFSTAEDMATFFKMMLRGGSTMDGNRILSPVTINSMTQDHTQLGDNAPGRGLGWDLTSSYSSQKGDLFTSGYGHTGFTGTSVWVVPEEKLAIIILSNRVHPYGKGDVTPLRARIANIIAGSITTSYRNETSENMK